VMERTSFGLRSMYRTACLSLAQTASMDLSA
jgi:hypothetical protein